MARTGHLHLLFALFSVVALTATFLINSPIIAQATSTASDSMDVQVDHMVQVRNGGLIVINDTVKLFAQDGELRLEKFTLGFPFIYRSNLEDVFAYDAANQQLDVKYDVGLGMIGFYGVEIGFPQSIDISSGDHYEFTVVFVFSNLISSQISPFMPEPGIELVMFNATFPAYPSLTQNASAVNFKIAFPTSVRFTSSSFGEKDIEFTNTTSGAFQIFNYARNDLAAFAYEPFWLKFEGSIGDFIIIDVKEIKRDISVDSWKHVLISDSYEIIPKAGDLSELKIQLPQGAFEVSAWDYLGNRFEEDDADIVEGNMTTPTKVTLTFSPPYIQDESAKVKLTFQVPWENIISQSDWQNYLLALSLFENSNWTIEKLVVTLTLPEGAKFTRLPESGVIHKSAFHETLTFVYHDVTPFQNLSQEATYQYTVFWASFRPTLWVGTAVTILGVLALLWRAPRPAAPIPTIPVKPEELKSYVAAYEQKRRSLSDLETLEERARKRKIPRRRYKVRKRALESRLSVLSKDLARLREKLQTASSKYADMMRQVEIAEAELEGIEAGIRRTETRYRRGEISTAAYHKLLEDYYRRRERTRTTIDGVLIRLREEVT